MILVRNLKLKPGEPEERLRALAAKKLRIPVGNIHSCDIVKRSLDARKKPELYYVYAVAVAGALDERALLRNADPRELSAYERPVYTIPQVKTDRRPLVVGFGPGGMFAALVLARAGARPIVVERGQDADTRSLAVERLRTEGILDPENNVQFGEGGAGTFSDGKLNTGTKDPRIAFVLEQFAAHGAPEKIKYEAKPHIGTDILVEVVKRFREEITALGGEVRFGTRFERPLVSGGTVTGAELSCGGKTELLPCGEIILAIGHSARDTFEHLNDMGIPMERKPFSMGVRIEHLQRMTDLAQYGKERGSLPAADYSLNVHLPDGTSAYTFCMCPGGEVFAAASEEDGVVTNGMSYSRRDGENSNAALLVTLHTEDFPGEGVLAGMYWQRSIEQAAYRYGGGSYCAPAQLAGDFLRGVPSTGARSVQPTYKPGVVWGDLREVLPPRITGVLQNALPELGKKLRGFDNPDAVMTAPETRSSSPVRILRGEDLSSPVRGLYPCGEGAGYAGGITSAAVDGIRCAEAVLEKLKNG